MNKYRILLVTAYYNLKGNSASIRNNALCKGLIELGHTVDVLTVEWPNEVKSNFFIEEANGRIISSQLLSTKIFQKIQDAKKSRLFNLLLPIKNFMKDLIYFPDILSTWGKNLKDLNLDLSHYDLLISSSDLKSSHFAAVELKKKCPSLNYIQIWGDPWFDDISLKSFLKPLVKYYEKRLLKEASKIFYVSELTFERQKQIYDQYSHKMAFCPRGYYKTSYSPLAQDVFRILYPGYLGYGRDISSFASFIDFYNNSSNTEIKLVVYTNKKMENYLSHWKCVEFHPSQDFPVILREYERSSALLFIANEKSSNQIPGKLFDFFGTNLPIFCLLNKNSDPLAKILEQFPRCLVISNTSLADKHQRELIFSELLHRLTQRYDPESSYSPRAVAQNLICKISLQTHTTLNTK